MSTPKAIIGVLLIFFFGIVTGVALSVKLTDARVRQLTTGGPNVLADLVVRRLGRQLELTAVQREQIYTITKQATQKMAAAEPLPSSLGEAAEQEIRAILTPAQATKFDAIVAEHKSEKP